MVFASGGPQTVRSSILLSYTTSVDVTPNWWIVQEVDEVDEGVLKFCNPVAAVAWGRSEPLNVLV